MTHARLFTFTLLAALALGAPAAFAQSHAASHGDRVTFGGDIVVPRGETVGSVVTMGGDARIDGRVLHDVVTMGGDADVRGQVGGSVETMGGDIALHDGGRVDGNLDATGGTVHVAPGAHTGGRVSATGHARRFAATRVLRHGPIDDLASFFVDTLSSAVGYGMLFLLGLLMMGLTPERLGALQSVIVRRPLHTGVMGTLGFIASVVSIVVLALTIVGIPAALLVALALPLAVYVGLAAAATVIGAALPVTHLRNRPVLQLAAGVGVLFVCSLVPDVGSVAIALAAVVGLGAVIGTRLRKTPPPPATDSTPAGPYRTATV